MSDSPQVGSPWTGVVLVGGSSRRMGEDKATLRRPDGRTWLKAALDTLDAAGADELLVVGGEAVTAPTGRWIPDLHPGQGPLAGLEAALHASRHPWCLLVACDMPQLEADLLRRILDLREGGLDAVVPEVDGRLQPLHAAYHRRCLAAIEEALRAGRRSLQALVPLLAAKRPPLPACPSFFNANTPEDAERLTPGGKDGETTTP
jgi:molybdopterin-guanine dinucleotide biosynthesis protein A